MIRIAALILPALLIAACGSQSPPAANAPAENAPAHVHPASNSPANEATDPHAGHTMPKGNEAAPHGGTTKVTFNWDELVPPVKTHTLQDLKNEKDPVSLKPVAPDAAVTVDYKGFRVHFESQATRDKFNRKPLKYLNMLSLEPAVDGSVSLVDAATYQDRVTDTCPVMVDSEVDPHGTVYLLHRGYKFFFCCWTGCGDAFMQDPAKYYAWYGLVEKDGKLIPRGQE